MNWLKKNRLTILILLIVIAGYSVYKYTYKPHKTIEKLTPNYVGTSNDFLEKASTNFKEWNSKVVELTGDITSIDSEGITLNNQIFCQFKTLNEIPLLKLQQTITLKGRVIGYDDLLNELKLNQCIVK